jgi:xylulokinase
MHCLGIDIGTQSLKVVILKDGKEILSQSSEAYGMLAPKPGWAEQDPKLWEAALSKAAPAALAGAGLQKHEIDSLAVAAQLDGCLAVDAQCQPLTDCLVWMDRRAIDSLPVLDSEEQHDFNQRTGLVMDASHMAAKVRWLRANQSGLQDARFHQPTSYLVERLCGAFTYDHALASTSMLYRLADRAYDETLLRMFEIEPAVLPRVARANEVAGQLSEEGARLCGLAAGIPVAVGTGDDFATALGAGVVQPGALLCVLGTAEVVASVSIDPLIDSEKLVETHGYLGHYLLENPGWLSGGARVWLRSLLSIASDKELDALAATAPPGCEGLSFIPALSGAMAPEWQASARACFYGLTKSHGPAHMARALLEGCAFAMLDVRARLQAMGVGDGSILLVGGGARSNLWAQIRADLCQAPVTRDEESENSAIGAALLAHSSMDGGASLTTLATNFPRSRDTIVAQPQHAEAYRQAYQRYRALFESLRPMWTW